MSAKRALVVDDSKSARAFLSKILEEHALEVDSAETAELAIDYLTRHRPDVIFMDHLMPGMDGFQAVQAIKSNPRTATIPILMFTSQEGELYLGQARALGAMGVLPKQVAPADVGKVLQQLHLTDQPLEPVAESLDAASLPAPLVSETTGSHPTGITGTSAIMPVGEILLRDQISELRRFMVSSLDEQSERVLEEVRNMLRNAAPPAAIEPVAPEPPRNSVWPWWIAVAASLLAGVLGAMAWNESQERMRLEAQLADVATRPATRAAPLANRAATPATSATAEAPTSVPALTVVAVPFGEAPLAGSRIEQLRKIVNALAADGFHGTVEVRRFVGRFCLGGDRNVGFTLADTAVPYLQCNLVADANDADLGALPAESLAFANALAELRKAHGEAIRIDVAEGDAATLQHAYPEIGGTPARVPTAGEWNVAAEANNRVEIRWHQSG
jgi:CheY-like chemotaxis protein